MPEKLVECRFCKTLQSVSDVDSKGCCDNCFEKHFDELCDENDLSLQLFHGQAGTCYLCGKMLTGDVVLKEVHGEERLICSPSCSRTLPDPVYKQKYKYPKL